MTERIAAWQCIGCGRIEGTQTCIGICEDRKRDFVPAADYDEVLARAEALTAVVRQLACTIPHDGAWETAYRALQARAQRTLKLPTGEAPGATA